MKNKIFILLAIFLIPAMGASIVQADEAAEDLNIELEEDYPWQDHAEPFDFPFGNMIDSHQQSHLDVNGVLHGFIYIYDTGKVTVEGYPIAEKAHCPTGPCMVGWVIKGIKIKATLVYKSPRVWLVDPADLPKEPGYSHFHWLGSPHSPGGPNGLIVGQEYEGYLMKRIAKMSFLWLGGPGQGGSGQGGSGGGCGNHDTGGEDEGGGCSDGEHDDGGCSGGGGDMGDGCSDGGDEGGCSEDDGGCAAGDEGGCSSDGGMGDDCSDGGDEGGCSGNDGGCSGDEGGCSGGGGDMGGSSSAHGGRLVTEGLDSHSNVVTDWDGTWQGGNCDD